MKVILKTEVGKSVTLNINPDDTFRDIKDRMVSDDGVPLDLFVNGLEVTDDQNVLQFFASQSESVEEEQPVAPAAPVKVICSVPGCNNTKATHPRKSFFRFPLREDRRQQWLLVCQREDLLDEHSAVFRSEHAICADHFTQSSFQNPKELRTDAVPTVFPQAAPGEEEDDVAATEPLIGGMLIKQEHAGHAENHVEGGEGEAEEDGDHMDADNYMEEEDEELASEGESADESQDASGRLCRLCACAAGEMVYIFSQVGAELRLAQMINATMPVSVCQSDKLPKQLCMSCLSRLNAANELAEESLRAEDQLKTLMKLKYFKTSSSSKDLQDIEDVSPGGSAKQCKLQDENEDPEGEPSKHPRGLCCPLCKEEDLCQVDPGSVHLDESYESDDETHDEDAPGAVDNRGNKYVVVDSGTAWQVGDGSTEPANEGGSVLGDRNDSNLPLDYLYQDSILPACKICGEVFPSVDVCLDHASVHIESNIFPCSLCDLCYTTEEDIAAHFDEHRMEEARRGMPPRHSKRLFCTCGRRFNSEKTLREHACATGEQRRHKCGLCLKAFRTAERLAFHQRFHDGAEPNFCEQCYKHFDGEGTLYYHTRMVHEHERRFSCEDCGKRFQSKARLVGHSRIHTGERPFPCDICKRSFYDQNTLKGHYITHMTQKPFQCEICGVYCARKTMLKQHMNAHHLGTSPRRVPSLIHYFCKECQQMFTSSYDVVNHRVSHLKDTEGHSCEYCNLNCQNAKALSLHQKREHQDERPYICSMCKNHSRTLYEARVHRKVHMGDAFDVRDDLKAIDEFGNVTKMCMCEKCGKIFEDKKNLSVHVKLCHLKECFYECEFCEKKFADNQRLTVHRRLHTGEKPFECQPCGKRFAQSSALYTHSLLHSGIKPHSCDLCGKTFRIKADKDNHRRTHTGEKPFKCEYCHKAFRTGQVYYQHRMIHTGERRFPCDVCGQAFKRSHTLVVHKRIHTGEKPNICDVCGKGFRQRTDMRKHRALHGMVALHQPTVT